MQRRRCLFVLLMAAYPVVSGGSAHSAPAPPRAIYSEPRRLLEAGAFERALRKLASRPGSELDRDPEGLILRGLARWGSGLDRFSSLAVQVGRLELVSQVKQLAVKAAREHPPGTPVGDRLARALPELEAAMDREARAVGEIGRLGDESCAALRMAEADFARAAQIRPPSRARWCESPERWLLLARAHRFSIETERASWGRDITSTGLAGLTTPERQQREQQLQELERSFLDELDRRLAEAEGEPRPTPVLHAAADALLVYGVSARRITRWPSAGGPHPTPLSVGVGAEEREAASVGEIRKFIKRDPTEAVIQLYRRCATPRGAGIAADTAYTNYLIELQSGEITLTRLAALAGDLRPQEVVGNPLLQLERARILSRQEGQEEAAREAVTRSSTGQLRRPVWTAAPAPIRTAFLRLPQWLRYGRQISVSLGSLLEKAERSIMQSDPPEKHAQLQLLRLSLGSVLATSDLPWDRETGYELAASALGKLEKLQGGLASDQAAAFVALKARLQVAAGQERFPGQLFAVLSDGRLAWVTDPTTQVTLSNPLLLVHRDGLTLAPPSPR